MSTSRIELPLPALNTQAQLSVSGWSTWRPTRIEDVDGPTIEVAAPIEGGEVVEPGAGTEVTLRWVTARGPGEVSGVVIGAGAGPVPTWCLLIHAPAKWFQRRAALRVPVSLAASVTLVSPGHRSRSAATVVELSETGARLAMSADERPAGGSIRICLTAGPAYLEVDARFVRLGPVEGGKAELVVTFCDPTPATASTIRAFVFAEQRRLRALEVGA